jgi:hypothetical protein
MMLQRNHNRHLLIFMANWTVVSLCYHLLTFRLARLPGDPYLNGLVWALSEFAGNILIGTFLLHFGAKRTFLACFSGMAVAAGLYLVPLLKGVAPWYACLLFALKFFLTGAFAGVFYGTNDLFRADLAAIIFALCNMVARLITMTTPALSTYSDATVMTIVFGMSLLGLASSGFIAGGRRRSKKKKKKKKRRHHE